MKKVILGGLGAAVLAAGCWYWLSPGLAMHSLKEAALSGDKDELRERVDFPAVRESLKGQFKAAMLAEMSKQKDNPFAALGMAFASAIVDPMIDGIVSPEGIKTMVASGKLKAKDQNGADAASDGEKPVEWQIERQGFDKFAAHPEAAPGEKAPSLIFKRDGLGWDLVDIEAPLPTARADSTAS